MSGNPIAVLFPLVPPLTPIVVQPAGGGGTAQVNIPNPLPVTIQNQPISVSGVVVNVSGVSINPNVSVINTPTVLPSGILQTDVLNFPNPFPVSGVTPQIVVPIGGSQPSGIVPVFVTNPSGSSSNVNVTNNPLPVSGIVGISPLPVPISGVTPLLVTPTIIPSGIQPVFLTNPAGSSANVNVTNNPLPVSGIIGISPLPVPVSGVTPQIVTPIGGTPPSGIISVSVVNQSSSASNVNVTNNPLPISGIVGISPLPVPVSGITPQLVTVTNPTLNIPVPLQVSGIVGISPLPLPVSGVTTQLVQPVLIPSGIQPVFVTNPSSGGGSGGNVTIVGQTVPIGVSGILPVEILGSGSIFPAGAILLNGVSVSSNKTFNFSSQTNQMTVFLHTSGTVSGGTLQLNVYAVDLIGNPLLLDAIATAALIQAPIVLDQVINVALYGARNVQIALAVSGINASWLTNLSVGG
jgi:hypothetical protein